MRKRAPKLYGGTERIVAYLTEELVRRGHEVTLFASGDSTANAKIQATYPAALRAVGLAHMGASLQVPALSEVFDRSDRFDIIHCHVDYWSFPFTRLVATPTVTTLHGRLISKNCSGSTATIQTLRLYPSAMRNALPCRN